MSHLRLRLIICGMLLGMVGCTADEQETNSGSSAAPVPVVIGDSDIGSGTPGTTGNSTATSSGAIGSAADPAALDTPAGTAGAATVGADTSAPVTMDEAEVSDGDDGDNAAATDPGDTEPGSEVEDMAMTDETMEDGQDFEGNFSFFVTSIEIMQELSGSPDGFGGDLGGLDGADEICQQAAATQGAGGKSWRAFLSTSTEDAIDRIGAGPWYDRNGRLVAQDIAGLLNDRPDGDPDVAANLPNERGEPLNQNGDDDHDVMTGSNNQGRLSDAAATCSDWTSVESSPSTGGGGRRGGGGGGGPQLGHSWPARSGTSWMQAHRASGCAPGVNLVQDGAGSGSCVGCGGGYGGIYCFALEP